MKTRFCNLVIPVKAQSWFFLLPVLNFTVSENAFTQWTQTQFIIGTYFDPRLSTTTDTNNTAAITQDTARFRRAKAAYFNLLTGTQSPGFINHTEAGMDYALFIAHKVGGMNYLVYDDRFHAQPFNSNIAAAVTNHYKALLDAGRRNVMYGYNIQDEPKTGDAVNLKAWISHFKTHDNSKLAYINLLPRYAADFTSDSAYAAYLDLYLNDANSDNNPDVVSFDYYPFHLTGTRTNYFYNLNMIRKKAGSRPFWVYPMSTGHVKALDPTDGYVDPDSTHLRFMVFCPIAYGAKGLIYFTYEQPPDEQGWTIRDAIINAHSTQTRTYAQVKTINHYVTKIVAPVVMNSTNLGAFHKSNSPTNESISRDQIINSKTPLISDLSNEVTMVGVFQDQAIPTTYYGLIVNKSLNSIDSNVVVTLKGNLRDKVTLSPSVVGYRGSTTYRSISTSYDSTKNKTTFTIAVNPATGVSLTGGEGRIFKVAGLSNPYITASSTDCDGNGNGDLRQKHIEYHMCNFRLRVWPWTKI